MVKKLLLLISLVTEAYAQITVNWTDNHQVIDGFGAAAAFGSQISSAQADTLYGLGAGQIGLSLLRVYAITDATNYTCRNVRIVPAPPGSGTILAPDLDNALKAHARGVTVWAASWSVPAAMKDNSDYCTGGNFLGNTSNYTALASILTGFVTLMQGTYGIPIVAISPQNEPDISQPYPSAKWTEQQFHDFVPYLRSALNAAGYNSTKVGIAEAAGWGFDAFIGATMADPITAAQVDLIMAHNYDQTTPTGQPAITGLTSQHLWQTEVCNVDPYDGSMTDGISWAQRIHGFLANAQVNAWFYWWTSWDEPVTNNGALTNGTTTGVFAKRAFVMGQWAHFVRPGWVEIGVTNSTELLATAFKDPVVGSFAVVVVNASPTDVSNQAFSLSGVSADAVTPYITDETRSIEQQSDVATTGGNSFTYTIPGNSVVTFYAPAGKIQGPPAGIAF